MPIFLNETNLMRDCSCYRRKWYSIPDPWEDSGKDSVNHPEPVHKDSERAVQAERSGEPVLSDSACRDCSHKDPKARADLPGRYSVRSNYSDKDSADIRFAGIRSAGIRSAGIRSADKDSAGKGSADIRAEDRPEAWELLKDNSCDGCSSSSR